MMLIGIASLLTYSRPMLNAMTILQYIFLESALLNYANHCRNWTFQPFALVAYKRERIMINKEFGTSNEFLRVDFYRHAVC